MGDDAREFLDELRAEWRNSYWWADHPTLRIALMSVAAGIIGLTFHYLELRLDRAMEVTQ